MHGQLGTSDIARLLGISRPRVWQLRKDPSFPEPSGRDEQGREYWYEAVILRWAAASRRGLAEKAPLVFRPASGKPARYLGTSNVDGYVVPVWDSELGRVGFVYSPRGFQSGRINKVLLDLLPKTAADVLVGMDAGHHDAFGPDLRALDAAFPDRVYSPRWADLSQVLGMAIPYWPSGLTIPAEMAKWRPGTPPVALPPRHPDLDTAPLLRLVADSEDGSAVAAAALALARAIDAQAADAARSDLSLLNEAKDREFITLAATPLEASMAAEMDESFLRAGWKQILDRNDRLAEDSVELALQWNAGRYFPFATPNTLDPARSAEAAEFRARLQPDQPTAAAQVFDRLAIDEYLVDPATDAPAVLTQDGKIVATVPYRLPALTPLAEVVLRDNQVWIRVQDGTLYLAPEDGTGLTWGYSGGGPMMLAILLDRLLDDIHAPAVTSSERRTPPPPKLEALIENAPKDEGAVFTREQLLAARADT